MFRSLLFSAVLCTLPFAAAADQLTGQEAFEVLTAATRTYSGGSVSTFRPDGTFVFTHADGRREEGTYRITQRGLVQVNDATHGSNYTFVVSERGGQYFFTYRSGPGRGNTYSFE